jgi:hypothetical protein
MALTNFPNGVSSFGIPMLGGGGIPSTNGRYIFVDADNGVDGNDGASWETAVKTINFAYSLATSNKDDVIVLSTTSTAHTLTALSGETSAMLNITKSRVHFVGDQFGRMYGQRARIVMGVTTDTDDVFAVKNTAVGTTFNGIKFDSGNTLTEAVGTVGEGGEYAVYRNCEFYNSAKLTSDTHAELVLNGDSSQFYNCTFGSLADAVSGDKIRPAVYCANGTVASGKVCRDVLFSGCRFWKKAGGTTTAMVSIPADADIERGMEFYNCQFIANVLGSTPAVAISVAAALTNGYVMLSGNTCAFECTKIATQTGIFSGLSTKVATATIGIQCT